MRVIGVDPSVTSTGIAVLEKENNNIKLLYFSSIETKASRRGKRYIDIFHELHRIFWLYGEPKTIVVIESGFCGVHKSAIQPLARVQGITISVCCLRALDFVFCAPAKWKKIVIGSGKATKDQIRGKINEVFPQTVGASQDAIDAIAIAYSEI